MLDATLLIVGLALILGGANYLTDGSVAIAKRFGIPEFVVGLTIIAIGTSMPEMVVSLLSALHGNGDIAVGGVVGSNIFNTFGILGTCALIRPMAITQNNIRRDIPMGIFVSLLLVAVGLSGRIMRIEGVVLLLIYISMMYYTISGAKKGRNPNHSVERINIPQTIIFVLGGFAALIGGGEMFLNSAVNIAHKLNIPQNVIAVTLVAGGTSLPEFAASVVSLLKGKSDIALGNVIGSNVANVLLVLGTSAAVSPVMMDGITEVDMLTSLLGMIMLFISPFILKKMYLGRVEASAMLICFAAYLYYTVAQ